jgi:hypothetical protein
MLENYKKLSTTGVIRQVDVEPIVYDEKYVVHYNAGLGGLSNELSCLRLGAILGCLNQPINKILDVGYGDGNFLEWASKVVEGCYAYDSSPAYPLPSNRLKMVNDTTSNYYDVVTFFNSLEHMPDIDFLENLRCKYVIITVPWCHYFSDDWFKGWKHRKPNEHIWHFNDESLNRMMRSKGYSSVYYSNLEDIIRGEKIGYPSYLTAVFSKG